jgi:two-component system sensor histidine kinase SenX3
LSDGQRRLLEEAEKSCGRLSALIAEMSDLSNLEAATSTFNPRPIDAAAILAEAVESLPPTADRQVPVETRGRQAVPIKGDSTRLRSAFVAILAAVRRELVPDATLVVHQELRVQNGRQVAWILTGDEEAVTAMSGGHALGVFDEWRGGNGLSLMVSRRIVEAHGGAVWAPPGDKPPPGAAIELPIDGP